MRASSRKDYYDNYESRRKSADKYKKSKIGLMVSRKANKVTYKKNLYKFRTRYLTKIAIRKGWLAHLACEKCGNFLSEVHHLDYSDPYNVWWLCQKHHTMADNGKLFLYGGEGLNPSQTK